MNYDIAVAATVLDGNIAMRDLSNFTNDETSINKSWSKFIFAYSFTNNFIVLDENKFHIGMIGKQIIAEAVPIY